MSIRIRGFRSSGSELDEFGPAQPGLDQHLGHQPGGVARERGVELVELVGGDDRPQLLRHRRSLHSAARVQPGDLVVERRREHRRQDGVTLPDHRRRRTCGFQIGHPLADVGGLDLVDPHRPEHRQDVLVQVVGVGLAGPGFHLVVREPHVFDVAAEPLPRPPCVRTRPSACRSSARCHARVACSSVVNVPALAAVAFDVVIECLVATPPLVPGRSRTNPTGVTPFPASLQGGPVLSLICHPNCLSGAVWGDTKWHGIPYYIGILRRFGLC